MKTEQECYALLGKHVQTPKGEGVVRNFSVRFGENGIAAFYVFNVELDSGDDPRVARGSRGRGPSCCRARSRRARSRRRGRAWTASRSPSRS